MTTIQLVRDATTADLPGVVAVHSLAFPGFLMTLLGPKFLSHYYGTVLAYPGKIFLVAADPNGKVIGFVAGFRDPAAFYALFEAGKRKAMAAALFRVLVRPWIWPRVLENMRQVRNRASLGAGPAATDAELASIAVSPAVPRAGHGKVLVRAFIERADALGVPVIVLTTDAKDNDVVNRFYQGLGFRLESTTPRASGREMNHYSYTVRP